jgi:hypothetical protein
VIFKSRVSRSPWLEQVRVTPIQNEVSFLLSLMAHVTLVDFPLLPCTCSFKVKELFLDALFLFVKSWRSKEIYLLGEDPSAQERQPGLSN